MRRILCLAGILPVALFMAASVSAAPYTITADSIHRHIEILASDSLEGRETGEIGEWKAAQYLIGVFQAMGLEPKGDDGSWLQSFEFTKRIDFSPANSLTINGEPLELNEEYQPMLQSADAEFDFDQIISVGFGITNEDSTYDDYAGKDVSGKAVVIKRYSPTLPDGGADTTFDKYSSIADKVALAVQHEAAGIFFVTPENQDDTLLGARGFTHVTPKDIPIVWLRRKGLERLGLDITDPAVLSAEGQTELVRVRDTGYNVVALLPTDNDSTTIIGAHYDHLGWGTFSSRYMGKEPKIHYGADDNGSGVAAMMELARYFAARRDELNHSMLFIAFGGEEKGLLGSMQYARNMTVDSSKVHMMINMDMIGRLREQDKGLAIMGTGTCPQFKAFFDSTLETDLKLSLVESGSGPSDHTAFYNRNIPVLNFFTGVHEDYHKPSDVIELIDCDGIVKVTDIVKDIITYFDRAPEALAFQRTKDAQPGGRRAFSVTLGIMPDHVTEVRGLRVDGVSPDRPAERAGVLSGDVIIQIGDYKVDDIYTYMSCLSKFRKGDSTVVVVERGADTLDLDLVFQ